MAEYPGGVVRNVACVCVCVGFADFDDGCLCSDFWKGRFSVQRHTTSPLAWKVNPSVCKPKRSDVREAGGVPTMNDDDVACVRKSPGKCSSPPLRSRFPGWAGRSSPMPCACSKGAKSCTWSDLSENLLHKLFIELSEYSGERSWCACRLSEGPFVEIKAGIDFSVDALNFNCFWLSYITVVVASLHSGCLFL